jgi:hypothetical protein
MLGICMLKQIPEDNYVSVYVHESLKQVYRQFGICSAKKPMCFFKQNASTIIRCYAYSILKYLAKSWDSQLEVVNVRKLFAHIKQNAIYYCYIEVE